VAIYAGFIHKESADKFMAFVADRLNGMVYLRDAYRLDVDRFFVMCACPPDGRLRLELRQAAFDWERAEVRELFAGRVEAEALAPGRRDGPIKRRLDRALLGSGLLDKSKELEGLGDEVILKGKGQGDGGAFDIGVSLKAKACDLSIAGCAKLGILKPWMPRLLPGDEMAKRYSRKEKARLAAWEIFARSRAKAAAISLI
jgi:hypothetical protein